MCLCCYLMCCCFLLLWCLICYMFVMRMCMYAVELYLVVVVGAWLDVWLSMCVYIGVVLLDVADGVCVVFVLMCRISICCCDCRCC